jgi:hypothetical protein
MARYNPEIMMVDDGQEQPRRVFGPRTDTSQISEEDMYKASRDAAIELGVDSVTLAYEAGMAGDTSTPLNKMTPEERAAFARGRADKVTQNRETGNGTEPPSEAPPGTHWSFIGGQWKLYKDFEGPTGPTGPLGGPGGGPTGSPTGTPTGTPVVTGLKTAEQIAAETKAAQDKEKRQSAYDLLYEEFNRYGLASLVTPLKDLITSGVSPSEFTLKLRDTDAYRNRFAANQARVKNGLRALSEAEYIRNEDAYQEVMRRRGLPASYYEQTTDPVTGITKQKGFEALLAGDVSSTELEDRIVTAQDRVINANPEIAAQLKQFYPGISNGDILAYTLDPANAINAIKRKVTAAEIGAAAGTYGLGTTVGRAEQLAGAGVTEATAQQGFKTISQVGPRAGVLAQYYKQDPYTQETAEREFFGLTGAREAEMQRKKLTSLEQAAFSGSAGAGAIARDRAGVL